MQKSAENLGEELLGPLMGGILKEVLRGTFLNDGAVVP